MDAPRTDLVRAVREAPEVGTGDDGSTLTGHFAVFDQWTEIDSVWEGRFMERLKRGAFAKTIAENLRAVKVLFNHGHDPTMGDQILGPPETVVEDDYGARYEVPLFDGIPALILSGLRSKAYGASFRFRVLKDTWQDHPERSAENPDGIPERTVTEVQLYEFGPVTFPAYSGATAGVRSISLTDDWRARRGLIVPSTATPDREPATTTDPEPQPHSTVTARERRLRALELRGITP